MTNDKEVKRTFGELRKEWFGEESENINYFMPVCIGVIAQDYSIDGTIKQLSDKRINKAVKRILKVLSGKFGKFKKKKSPPSHNQLVVLRQSDSNTLTNYIASYLEKHYGAILVDAGTDDIEKYCWATIAAFENGTSNSPKFPAEQPIFRIVLDGTKKRYKVDLNKKTKSNEDIKKFNANARKTKRFNNRIKQFSRKIDERTEDIYDLLPWHHFNAQNDKLKKMPKCVETANLREIFCDVISMDAQKEQKWVTRAIILFASVGLLGFSLYSDLPVELMGGEPWTPFIITFLITMAVAFGIYFIRVVKGQVHSEYLEFRALAEGMRVQCYWYAAKIDKFVGTEYTVKFDKDMQWAQKAFNAWYLADFMEYRSLRTSSAGSNNTVVAPSVEEYNIIKAEWLGTLWDKSRETYLPKDLPKNATDDLKEALGDSKPGGQYGFYYKKSTEHGDRGKRYENVQKGLLAAWFVIYLLLVLSLILPYFSDSIFIFLMGIVNIAIMVLTCAASVTADKELAAKYSYCLFMSQKAVEDYEKEPSNIEKAKQIFIRFGCEELEENAEWLMIKNNCEPEVPNG